MFFCFLLLGIEGEPWPMLVPPSSLPPWSHGKARGGFGVKKLLKRSVRDEGERITVNLSLIFPKKKKKNRIEKRKDITNSCSIYNFHAGTFSCLTNS